MLGKEKLLELLEQKGVPFACEHHEQVLNMAESAQIKLSLAGVRCKNLLLQDKQGQHYLVVTTPDKSLDLGALAEALGSKRLSFASAERLATVLGIGPGSLSPLALVNDADGKVHLVIDQDLSQEPIFLLHPLENTATVALAKPDLEAFLENIGHPATWRFLKGRATAGR